MSSNITITRICQYCNEQFIARTTVTKFCGTTCSRRAGKLLAKQKKIDSSNEETSAKKNKQLSNVSSFDYLKVAEAALMLRCAKSTIYDLINSGRINATNLGVRKTLIKRSEIDKLFNQEPFEPLINLVEVKPLKISECYNMREAIAISGMSESALNNLLKKNNIRREQHGWYSYVRKADIHKIFNIKPDI